MRHNKIPDLTKRIESILSGHGKINDYSGQVVAEAIIQLLVEEGLLASRASSIRIKKEKK